MHFSAQVLRDGETPSGGGAAVTVNVQRFVWDVGLSASKNPVTVGDRTRLTATVNRDPRYTGYTTAIVNDDTGETLVQCYGLTCTTDITPSWSENKDPQPIHAHAEVRRESGPPDTAGRADLTVDVDSLFFGVDFSLSEPTTNSAGQTTSFTSATVAPPLSFTPYSTKIRKKSGELVTSCTLPITCRVQVGPGTYRASVEDASGTVFGQSGWWSMSADGAHSETVDDLDLVTLAAAFPSTDALCEKVLVSLVRTHIMQPPSSLSDQYRVCIAAAAAGTSVLATLALVADAGDGTAILWDLEQEITRETTSPDPSDDDPPENPPPAPPI